MNKRLDLAAIILDSECQPRLAIDTETLGEYVEALKAGAEFPPVNVIYDGSQYYCYDGFHRVLAYQQAKRKEISADITKGSRRDAILFSLRANATHGLRRTNADKRNAVLKILNDAEWSKKKDVWIAKQCGVVHQTVANVRANLASRQPDKSASNGHSSTDFEPDPDAVPFALQSPPAAPAKNAPAYITLEQYKGMKPAEREAVLQFPLTEKTFNKQDTLSIEWARWSWNPITGCLHNCPYCYARDIAERFYEQKFAPAIIPDRFLVTHNLAVPAEAKTDPSYKNVFVCSMADLFGRWVPGEWIEAVLNQVRDTPQWNFLFLTKFPQRMAEFKYPKNAWLGTTVDLQARVKNAERAFEKLDGGTKWLSLEPLLEPLKFSNLKLFDWVVIGGASSSAKTPAWIPPLDWILSVHQQARQAGCKIYYKDNCGFASESPLRLREFPWQQPTKTELPSVFRYLKSS